MFYLYKTLERVNIDPGDLKKPEFIQSLVKQLEKKYCNKVFDKGFAISIVECFHKSSIVMPREGNVQENVEISVLVFNPWKDEVLKGKIKKQTEEGIVVDMGFIEAFIPAALTTEGSFFDDEKEAWFWKYEDLDKCYYLEYQTDEEIKFSVHSTDFSKPKITSADTTEITEYDQNKVAEKEDEPTEIVTTKFRYTVIGSCQKEGLGMKSWWANS
ncbi:unnamed protein product [Moneuplotes crassus]|uniref:S1 motif domain-containing protein n=2 Tax=Euplotes crassus TaxID=5936 RepID=A0AAD1XU39_EUPCR|nr:unnamed protein product [Moneuplotes crassus]